MGKSHRRFGKFGPDLAPLGFASTSYILRFERRKLDPEGFMRKTITTAIVTVFLALGSGCGEADLGGAPDVRGLPLDDAKIQLKKSGYTASESSDALFGVIVEENFTVCKQGTPKGRLVPLEVSKSC